MLSMHSCNVQSNDKPGKQGQTGCTRTIITTYLFVVTCCFHSASRCSLLSSSHLSLSYSIPTSSLFHFICSNWAACVCLSRVFSATLAEGFLKCAPSWLISKTEVLVKLSARWPIHDITIALNAGHKLKQVSAVFTLHAFFAIFFVWQS